MLQARQSQEEAHTRKDLQNVGRKRETNLGKVKKKNLCYTIATNNEWYSIPSYTSSTRRMKYPIKETRDQTDIKIHASIKDKAKMGIELRLPLLIDSS